MIYVKLIIKRGWTLNWQEMVIYIHNHWENWCNHQNHGNGQYKQWAGRYFELETIWIAFKVSRWVDEWINWGWGKFLGDIFKWFSIQLSRWIMTLISLNEHIYSILYLVDSFCGHFMCKFTIVCVVYLIDSSD